MHMHLASLPGYDISRMFQKRSTSNIPLLLILLLKYKKSHLILCTFWRNERFVFFFLGVLTVLQENLWHNFQRKCLFTSDLACLGFILQHCLTRICKDNFDLQLLQIPQRDQSLPLVHQIQCQEYPRNTMAFELYSMTCLAVTRWKQILPHFN